MNKEQQMKIVIKPYSALPCEAEIFTINGMKADKDDFGEKNSMSDGNYGCSYNYFEGNYNKKHIAEICSKYGITELEYLEVVKELESIFHVRSCGWCV